MLLQGLHTICMRSVSYTSLLVSIHCVLENRKLSRLWNIFYHNLLSNLSLSQLSYIDLFVLFTAQAIGI